MANCSRGSTSISAPTAWTSRAARIWPTYAGHTLYQGATWRVSDFVRLGQTVALNLAAEARDLRYEDFPFLSGWQYVGNAEVRHAITPASSIFGGLTYIRGLAAEDPYAFTGYGINVRYTHELKGGWIGSLFYQYSWYGFDGVDPFFGVVRVDSDNRVELSVTNRYLSYKGFAPRLTVGTDDRTIEHRALFVPKDLRSRRRRDGVLTHRCRRHSLETY